MSTSTKHMTPHEFALWMLGVVDLVGDEPLSQAHWETIKTAHAQVIAALMKAKLSAANRESPLDIESVGVSISPYHCSGDVINIDPSVLPQNYPPGLVRVTG